MAQSVFTADGGASTGGTGTVTQVTGTANQIAVANPTNAPVISFDPSFQTAFTQLQDKVASQTSSSLQAGRNFLINGEGVIAQRGASGSASFSIPSSATRYVDDCWQIQTNGTPITVAQVAGPNGLPGHAIKISRTANSTVTNAVNYGQSLSPDLTAQMWAEFGVFSFAAIAGSNQTGTLTAVIIGGQSTGYISQLAPGFTSPITLATYQVPLTTNWANYQLVLPQALASSYNQIYVGFIIQHAGQAGADDSVTISRRQFEIGTTASPYEAKTLQQYLFDCKPYCHKTYDLTTAPGTNTTNGAVCVSCAGYGNSYSNGYSPVAYPRTMLYAPTVTAYDYMGGASTLMVAFIGQTALTLENGSPAGSSGSYAGSAYLSQLLLEASP
jgi:hypothetical protein